MAGIYLSRCEPCFGRRDFHLADRPLSEIARPLGVRPEAREALMPEHVHPDHSLMVFIAVEEEEAKGTPFRPGYYRAAITPHRALKHCGVGLSAILGMPLG